MIDKELLSMLVCPLDNRPLSPAGGPMVTKINRAIAEGRVKNRAGQPVNQAVEGGLINSDKNFFYPILDGIPVLVADEAIPLSQIR
jgi:uncharacterized protein YbaR (Trm112 family)